jgi:iron complex outermembrane receptor protein
VSQAQSSKNAPAVRSSGNTASTGRQGIEEIVVTAQKRAENIEKIPISVTALGEDDLKFRGVNDLSDLQFQVPGLYFGNGTTGNQRASIRGVGTNVDTSNVEVPIASYVDGVYQARSFRSPNLGLDLKRVEVLRGPQGTLFGRNATGGALNIILQEPTDDYTGKVKLGIGNYGQGTVQGVASGPLVKGLLSGRLAGLFDHYDGDVQNVFQNRVTGKWTNGQNNGAGRLALRYTPLESLSADLSLLANKQTGGATVPQVVNILAGDPLLEAQGTVVPPTQSMPNLFINGHHPHKARINSPMKGDAENYQGALNTQWDFSWGSLKSITGYQDHVLFKNVDLDGTARSLYWYKSWRDSSRAFTQEFNLYGSTQWFTWLAGSHFMHEDYETVFDPIALPDFAFGQGLTIVVRAFEKVDSYSFFGDGTVLLPWSFKLFGGLRFTHDQKSLLQSLHAEPGSGLLVGPPGTASPILIPGIGLPVPQEACENLRSKDSFHNVSPRYGLGWEPTEDVDIYVKESFGYNAGGHNFTVCNNAYKSETLDTIEGGVKTTWFRGRLVANTAIFTNDYKNFQTLKNSSALLVEIVNAPAASMVGAELELMGRPLDQLTVNAGTSLLHSEYVKFEDTDPTNPNAGVQNLKGHQLSGAPNYTVNLGAEYEWPLPDRWQSIFGALTPNALAPRALRFRPEWFHSDLVVFRPYASSAPYGGKEDKQKNYSIFNLFVTVTSRDEKLELRLFGKNLLDRQYYAEKFGTAFGQRIGIGAPPRTFGAELTYSF